MTLRTRILMATAGVAIAAGLFTTVWTRHGQATAPAVHAKASMVSDETISRAVQDAKLPVSGLMVRTVGDIVVLRGDARDTATIESAARLVRSLGVQRVANMIRVPQAPNDDAIRRQAERQVAQTRSLEGCVLRISCTRGVVLVTGEVHSELQEDTVIAVLRRIDGAQRIDTDLKLVQQTASR